MAVDINQSAGNNLEWGFRLARQEYRALMGNKGYYQPANLGQLVPWR
jgi:hypothetical protein